MKTLFALLTLLLSVAAHAGTYDITCVPPVTRTDGSVLPASEIQHYNWFVDGTQADTTTACAWTLDQPDGTYTVTATTVDTGGREGPQSPGKQFTLTTAPPNPPTLN